MQQHLCPASCSASVRRAAPLAPTTPWRPAPRMPAVAAPLPRLCAPPLPPRRVLAPAPSATNAERKAEARARKDAELAAALARLSLEHRGSGDAEGAIEAVLSALRGSYRGGCVPLEALDGALERLFGDLGVSSTTFRQYVKSQGVCLGNLVAYGSIEKLRRRLRACGGGGGLTIRKGRAKPFKFVKMCLVKLQ